MIVFKNNNNKSNLELNYITGINKKNKTYFVDFKISFIDNLFNGELAYLSKDELDEDMFMFRFDYESDWNEIQLYKSSNTIEEIYAHMGFFIDIINIINIKYNEDNKEIHYNKGLI